MKKKILLIIFLIILVVIIIIGQKFFSTKTEDNILEIDESIFTLGNNHLDQAVQDYLLSQKHFSWQTNNESRNFCVFENLDSKNELFPFYLWVRCGEFIKQNNELKELSGVSGPMKIDYPNELSFCDLEKFSYTIPRDGSFYAEDIKIIFPLNLQKSIYNFNQKIINQRIKNIANNNL